MNFIGNNIYRIPLFFKQWRIFGFPVAFGTLLFPFNRILGCLRPYIAVHKHRAILAYLYRRYNKIVDVYKQNSVTENLFIESNSKIWICWWDGKETMPPLVEACYASIQRFAGTYIVQLITKHNFREFVSVPEYILQKVNSGIITITHFSDILRAVLLYEHGGIWMDATVLVLKNIKLDGSLFFTLKAPSVKSTSISAAKFMNLCDKSRQLYGKIIPEINRWSGFLLAGPRHLFFFAYIRDMLYAYWKDHNDQIEYLLIDYIIALGYDNISSVKKIVDDVPCADIEKFALEKKLNIMCLENDFTSDYFGAFQKLTWKKEFNSQTKDKKLTYYGYILKIYCDNQIL